MIGWDDALEGATQKGSQTNLLRPSSPDPFRILDGVSVTPEHDSADEEPSDLGLPTLPWARRDGIRSPIRLGQNPSAAEATHRTQPEFQASPPENLLGIVLSEDEENIETASEAEQEPESIPPHPTNCDANADVTYKFSPNVVARRTSLIYDLPTSSGDEA